jgi:N-hydroxyarylamine O-acetyltransferase
VLRAGIGERERSVVTTESTVQLGQRESAPEWGTPVLDLDAYLRRIGYRGPRTATADTLRALHRAHITAISFENVDVALGRGVSIDLADLQHKLVESGRGGYCFEHNLLFAAALDRLGFTVLRLLGRVRRGSDRVRYRAHAALVVLADGRRWLADVGFGDEGLIEPIPLTAGARTTVGGWTWRVVREADQWVLQSLHPDGWFDLYAFRGERHFQVDFEVSNYYTAHSHRSTFVGKLVAMRGTDLVRHTLKDQELVTWYADGRTERAALTGGQVVHALRDTFGVRLTAEDATLLQQRFQVT